MSKGRKLKYTIKDMRELAEYHGGECLSKRYKGIMKELKWKCSNNHIWYGKPKNMIGRKSWCIQCYWDSLVNTTIEDIQLLANQRGGKCLSNNYVNDRTKLKFQCKKNHIWYLSPNKLKRGIWCPYCAGKYKTIVNMQEIAKKRDGKCISPKYLGSHTKLKWQCKEGHIWESIPHNIMEGRWCPECANISHSKEKHYLWKGGFNSKDYGTNFNCTIRRNIRKRDRYTCQNCGITEECIKQKLHVHHIDYNKKNNDKDNLISLCGSCHGKTNFDREDWTNYYSNIRRGDLNF